MLKYAAFIFLLAITAACSLGPHADEITRYQDYTPVINHLSIDYNMYKELFQQLYDYNLEDADIVGIMVSIDIHYVSDQGGNWKTPDETWDDGTGDCEDFCTAFLGILKKEGLYDGQTMIVINPPQSSAFSYHAKIADHRRNLSYELTGGLLSVKPLDQETILKEYSYAQVMYQACEKKRLDLVF